MDTQGAASQRGAERANRLAAGIERAVREAAGLDAVLAVEHAELLRFIARMTAASERRDLFDAGEPGPAPGSGPCHGADAPARIASVRLGELAADHALRVARAGTSPGETAAATRAWAVALERALARVAAHHRAVLLPARAVAAGAPDLTAEIEAAMAAAIAEPMADRAPPQPAPETRP